MLSPVHFISYLPYHNGIVKSLDLTSIDDRIIPNETARGITDDSLISSIDVNVMKDPRKGIKNK